jgi:hypothetical protein
MRFWGIVLGAWTTLVASVILRSWFVTDNLILMCFHLATNPFSRCSLTATAYILSSWAIYKLVFPFLANFREYRFSSISESLVLLVMNATSAIQECGSTVDVKDYLFPTGVVLLLRLFSFVCCMRVDSLPDRQISLAVHEPLMFAHFVLPLAFIYLLGKTWYCCPCERLRDFTYGEGIDGCLDCLQTFLMHIGYLSTLKGNVSYRVRPLDCLYPFFRSLMTFGLGVRTLGSFIHCVAKMWEKMKAVDAAVDPFPPPAGDEICQRCVVCEGQITAEDLRRLGCVHCCHIKCVHLQPDRGARNR